VQGAAAEIESKVKRNNNNNNNNNTLLNVSIVIRQVLSRANLNRKLPEVQIDCSDYSLCCV